MHSQSLLLGALVALPHVLAGYDDFYFCKEEFCDEDECPFYANSNNEYPECVVYSTEGLNGYGFEGDGKGNYEMVIDVPDLDPGCYWILRSPASTDILGCGYVAGTWNNGGCDKVKLDKTFMVQYCCGDNCEEAGIGWPAPSPTETPGAPEPTPRAVGGGASLRNSLNARSAGGVLQMHKSDGTPLDPIEQGLPPEKRGVVPKSAEHFFMARQDEDQACTNDSWVPSEKGYTKPSPQTYLVATGGNSGDEIQIQKSRTVGFETTMDVSLGLKDILGLGFSFTASEEVSETRVRTFTIPEGQQGDVGFTPYLKCDYGKAECGGEEVEGEFCSGYYVESGDVAGLYHVIQRGTGK